MNPIISMNHAAQPEPEYTPPTTDELKALEIASLENSIETETGWQALYPSEKNAAFITSLRAQLAALTAPVELPDSFETPAAGDPDETDHDTETAHARHGF